ncbi:hypothetical protein NKI34_19950 [Mesorhizobium sp. M0700]|uniref:hypothetical protein n=1 Tax=unclassified Mesorhizobium TaxID=325217 RepID=UPI00333761C0
MDKYVWASVLYYTVAAVGFVVIFVSINVLGILWGLLAIFGYLALVTSQHMATQSTSAKRLSSRIDQTKTGRLITAG